MNRLEYIQKINRYFPYLVLQIHTSTASGLFDINSVAEDFYLPILRLLYGCPSLENKNVIQSNFPAVDLACDASRKSFQITSENGSDKIIHTLKKFRDNNLDKKYDELWILVITSKQKSYLSKKLDEEIKNQKISFDRNVHIIDYTDIVAKIIQLPTNELEAIFKILEAEFSKQESFSVCRDELDNFLEISNAKIEVEKNTKKYIPAIFTESTKTKDIARLLVHPVFFYRKIEDKLSSINYDLLNEFLSMMGMAEIQSAIPSYIEATFPKNIQELPSILTALEKLIEAEIEKIAPFNPWGKSDPRPDFKVPPSKEAIKSLLKPQRESLCYGIVNRYGDVLDRIKLCNAKILLITSMAGQGKTNFVCDLIENQFKAFEIPSIFIPARELNSISTSPQIFNHIKKNRYLSSITDQYKLFEFFDSVSKELSKPFIIVIDGINEVKDLDKFNAELRDFLDAVSQFKFVKVIITCRSEFFDQRFSELLTQPFSKHIYRISDLKSEMSEGNLDRILRAYLKHFNIQGELNERAAEFLKEDLLLLRVFSELYENKDIGAVNDIYKDQLYEEYLISRTSNFDKALQKKVLPTLYGIVKGMISSDQYASLVIKDFDKEQIRIIDDLVSEDIVLKQEVPDKTLGTAGNETIAFTYDELRDFVIAHYLVHDLLKSDYKAFEAFFERLPKLPIYEGVFKYTYILSRKEKTEKITTLCESVEHFDEHYSNILWSLAPEYQTEHDVKIVTSILTAVASREAVYSIAFYLFKRGDNNELLNIKTLTAHINSLEDDALTKFFDFMFYERHGYDPNAQKLMNGYIEKWLKGLLDDESVASSPRFTLWLQVAGKSYSWIQRDVITVCARLKERGKNLEAFEFVSKAKSLQLRTLASAIKTYKEKSFGA